MIMLGTCYTIIWCHKLSKVRSVFENDILLTYIIHQKLVFGLKWPVKVTFLVFRTTYNAEFGAGNLSGILVEIHFMHFVYLWVRY